MAAIGGDAEGKVVVFGINGKSQIGGIGVVAGVEVDKVDVVAAKTLPAVRDEIERVAVGMQEREFFVARGVNAWPKIMGTTPVSVGQTMCIAFW